MYPAFVQPVSLWVKQNRWNAPSSVRNQLHASRCLLSRRVIASAQGWAGTRLSIPSFQRSSTAFTNPDLPGVHFSERPTITTEDLLQIIRGGTADAWVNEILRAFLGWRQMEDGEWNGDLVPQEWKEVYPDGPPDFIGKIDDYSPATDRPIKKAVQKLARSIPSEHKQNLLEVLRPKGFPGWTVKELTPNRTRRATAVNWILYWYKMHYPEYEWS